MWRDAHLSFSVWQSPLRVNDGSDYGVKRSEPSQSQRPCLMDQEEKRLETRRRNDDPVFGSLSTGLQRQNLILSPVKKRTTLSLHPRTQNPCCGSCFTGRSVQGNTAQPLYISHFSGLHLYLSVLGQYRLARAFEIRDTETSPTQPAAWQGLAHHEYARQAGHENP